MTIDPSASLAAYATEPCPVRARKLAIDGVVVSRNYCRMGQDYDCRCNYCCDASYNAAVADAGRRNAETTVDRARIVRLTTPFEALAQIGAAISAAGSPGASISRMIRDAGELRQSFGGEVRGFSYRVTGKRGSAKRHFGKVGVCKWVGKSEDGTTRIGLQIEGEEHLAYCAASQLERIPMTAESLVEDARRRTEQVIVREAIAPHRPRLVVASLRRGRPGPTAYVVSGRDAGKHGEVFWVGPDKRTGEPAARLGIRQADRTVIWASAYECADEPCEMVEIEERREIERVAADLALEGSSDKAREVLATTRTRARIAG